MPKRSPGLNDSDSVNKRFGGRLRLNREVAGLSQTEVGQALGVSFQQIQKYENGMTSISLNRLYDVASCLRIPITSLLDGLDGQRPGRQPEGFAETEQQPYETDGDASATPGPLSKEKVALLHAFGRIQNPKARRSIVALIEILGASDPERAEEPETVVRAEPDAR